MGTAGGLARVALDEAVDSHLRHPPPGRQLAPGDRDHPAGGLVQLGLARDVHRLLRVAGRDQGTHPSEGAHQIARVQSDAEEVVDGLEQVVDVLGRRLHMLEVALVVVVGGADKRASQPGKREDRPSTTRRHDRATHQRQVLAIEDHVRAAAGANARQLGLVVELFRAQLIGPHAGRVDHVRGAHLELRAALGVQRPHAPRASVLLQQPGDPQPVGADRAEALGLAEHGQHEADVVGLAVVEQVAARRLARGERRQQLDHLLA